MKKFSISIFLSLLILVFSNTGFIPVQSSDTVSSTSIKAHSELNSHINYPETEIENTATRITTAFQGHSGIQKTPAFYLSTPNTGIPVIAPSALYSSSIFEDKELFDNNYLSHNYPAHNFW